MSPYSGVLFILASTISLIKSETVPCNGNCNCLSPSSVPLGTTCTLDCGGIDRCKQDTLTCREGDPCIILCTGKSSCATGTRINAHQSTHVKIICGEDDACKDKIDINCGTGHCQLECYGSAACESFGNIDVSLSDSFICIGNCPNNIPASFSASPTLTPTITSSSPTHTPTNPTRSIPTTSLPTTSNPTTNTPTTNSLTTLQPTTKSPTTVIPTTYSPTTSIPTTITNSPTTYQPTTSSPTPLNSTTNNPTTLTPTTLNPTTSDPTTNAPTTFNPTTTSPTTYQPTTRSPTPSLPTTYNPTTFTPTTYYPTTYSPTTTVPTTYSPTTMAPSTTNPTTVIPTTNNPTTAYPTTYSPTTMIPTTSYPSITPSIPPTQPPTPFCSGFNINLVIQFSKQEWKPILKTYITQSFQHTVEYFTADSWQENKWCVTIIIDHDQKIPNNRRLLQANDIELDITFTFNTNLYNDYFSNYNKAEFINEYQTKLSQLMGGKEADKFELSDPINTITVSTPTYAPHTLQTTSHDNHQNNANVTSILLLVIIICCFIIICAYIYGKYTTHGKMANKQGFAFAIKSVPIPKNNKDEITSDQDIVTQINQTIGVVGDDDMDCVESINATKILMEYMDEGKPNGQFTQQNAYKD